MKKHFSRQIELIQKASSFDEQQSEKLMKDCLFSVKTRQPITITALGKNVPICEKIVGTLTSLSIRSRFMHANSAIHGDLGMVEERGLVIILSKSGRTEETLRLLRLLRTRNANIWLLTCNPKAKQGKDVFWKTMVLPLEHEGDPWNIIPNASSLIFLIFLQSLIFELIERVPIPLEYFQNNHPGGAIGKILKKRRKK